jgi:CheY-like chemotaxis protein
MAATDRSLVGVRVVLVEDELDALEFLAMVLASEGASVASFADPHAALDYLTTHSPDVLISDLYMPRMNGWELLERARMRGLSAPAAALTAHASADNRSRCVAAGFCTCIAKPLTPSTLVDVVRQMAHPAP